MKKIFTALPPLMIVLPVAFLFICLNPETGLAAGVVVTQNGTPHPAPVVTVAPVGKPGADISAQSRARGPSAEDHDGEGTDGGSREEDGQSSLDAAMDFVDASHDYWINGNEEKALEALDHAYGLIVKTQADDPRLAQQKEDLRFTISKRILEIYASRVRTVKGSHKAIPLTINKYVEREIALLTNEERHFFVEAYRRSGRYRGEIVKALKEEGLPEELSWLPLIESGFKVKALSRSRALGLWQFIPSTGYRFGLHRTGWIDERMDPKKSTAAAIAYFKELHDMFGDWATVLAAYNCGEGTVLRAISRQKREYLDNFWDLYGRLPRETARYYPRFLAVLAIVKNPERYQLSLDRLDAPGQFDVVPVRKQLPLSAIGLKLQVPFAQLTALNPELRRKITPPGTYDLKVPEGTGPVLQAGLDSLRPWSEPRKQYSVHRVRKGETLTLLALRYGTTVSAIIRSNKMRKKVLRTGQSLNIPLRETTNGSYRFVENKS